MSEKEISGQIRFSYGITLLQAIIKSLGVSLVLGILVIAGNALGLAGSNFLIINLVLVIFFGLNILAYIELSVNAARKGGAYRLVQTCEEGNWLAFITGWSILLAGISAGGLIVQSFGKQSAYLIQSILNTTIPFQAMGAGLLLLIFGLKIIPVKFKRNIDLLLILIGLLLISTLAVIPKFRISYLQPISADWQLTFTLLLVAYIGLEISTSTQGDIRAHSQNAPKLFLITTILTGVIISLVGTLYLGVPGYDAATSQLNPLIRLGNLLGGKWISSILTGLSLLAMPIALDRIISTLTRHLFSMTHDGFWPEILTWKPNRTRIPIIIIFLIILSTGLTIILPLPDLARVGSFFYLLVLMAVNFTLVKQKQVSSSFKLPIHPWIPALVLVMDLLVILSWGQNLITAGLLLLFGLIIYFVYGRHQSIQAKEGITVFKSESFEEQTKKSTRILVPIANPDTAESLLHLAGTLVKPEGGKVIALRVVTVPNQLPLSDGSIQAEADQMLLEQAIDQATKEEFRIQTMTRVSRSIAEGILDTAREEDVDQILVGWSGGESRSLAKTLGPVLDPIVKDAPCDVLIVKGFNWKQLNSILVPTAGGPNSPLGAKLAKTLSDKTGAKVTGLYIQVGRASAARMAENRKILNKTFSGLDFKEPPELQIEHANSVNAGILKEAEKHDLVIVGASEQGFIDQFAFGSIPQRIATQALCSSIMIKGVSGATDFWLRKVIQVIFNLFPTLSTEEQLEVREELIDDAQPGRDYFVLIILSSIIAALGLLLNSPAVVIGAMLVAPLMSPMMGFSMGIVLGELHLIRTSLEAIFKGVMATVIVSILIGLISPLKEMTPEIIARTQPTLLDLVIALASGMAGAYALSRKDVSAALPGVAIAAALAPPLSVVGLGIANGNLDAAGGALVLFVTNLITISLAGVLIFSLLGIHPLNLQPEIKKRVRRGITGVVSLVVLITIPLAILMNGIIRQNREEQLIERIFVESPILKEAQLLDLNRSQEQDQLVINATIKSPEQLTQDQVDELALTLEAELGRQLILDIVTMPVIRSK
jgi:uncharacterized hydrophobic protein (TIGR00271 family)